MPFLLSLTSARLRSSSTATPAASAANVMYDLGEIEGEINVIVIQENRELSNDLAMRIGHRHQSPQAFVMKDGKAIYHATHYGIDPAEIESKLRN